MLSIRYSTQAGRIDLTSDVDLAHDLQSLRARYATSATVNNQAFSVDIDDFLVNLHELANWPDQNVSWQSELLTLVEANAEDTTVLEYRLQGAETNIQLPLELGGGWAGNLTDFQQRDLAKLLELAHGANFSVPGAGKTRVGLAVFQARRDVGQVNRLLVVCPKSAFESWRAEAAICFPQWKSSSWRDDLGGSRAELRCPAYQL